MSNIDLTEEQAKKKLADRSITPGQISFYWSKLGIDEDKKSDLDWVFNQFQATRQAFITTYATSIELGGDRLKVLRKVVNDDKMKLPFMELMVALRAGTYDKPDGGEELSFKPSVSNIAMYEGYLLEPFVYGAGGSRYNAVDGAFSSNQDKHSYALQTYIEALDSWLSDYSEEVGVTDEIEGFEDLVDLEGDDLAEVIVPILTGRDPAEIKIEKNSLKNYMQCYLITQLLNTTLPDSVCETHSKPDAKKKYYDGRIIPVKMAEPKKFMNYCLYDSEYKDFFENKTNEDPNKRYNSSLTYTLTLIRADSKGVPQEVPLNIGPSLLDTATGAPLEWSRELQDELEMAQMIKDPSSSVSGYINNLLDLKNSSKLDSATTTINKAVNLDVTFDGTNPSTARKDVKADLTLQLTSFANLNSVIGSYTKTDPVTKRESVEVVRLYELITIPYGLSPSGDSTPGSSTRSQYSPDYNRLRLKIRCEILDEAKDDLVLDLAIIGHDISRNAQTGRTEMKINYRGYFETALSMPFLDSIASIDILNRRLRSDEQLKKAVEEDCSEKLIKEIIKLNRAQDAAEARNINYKSIIKRLFDNNKIYRTVGLNERGLRTYVLTGEASVGGFPTNPVRQAAEVQIEERIKTISQLDEEKVDKKVSELGNYEINSHYFLLGDLLHAVTDCIYDGEKLRDHVKNLKLKFLIPPMTIAHPEKLNQSLSFSPLSIPIDMYYFTEWFKSSVVDKGVTYYPVMTMIRDLLERLVNNLIYDNCFGHFLSDERPPLIRTTFFTDTKPTNLRIRDKVKADVWGVNLDTYMKKGENKRDKVFWIDSNKTGEAHVTNYCVIYMQSFNNILPYSGGKAHYEDEFIPTIKFGINTDDSFINQIKFSKTNTPGLKEARYFNVRNSLSILSNVYDLEITLKAAGATTLIYPGQILNVELTDFDRANRDPHKIGTLANTMGIGGYYIVKKVSYKLPTETSNYTIVIDTKWIGTQETIKLRKSATKDVLIDKAACIAIYNDVAERVLAIDPDVDIMDTMTNEDYRSAAERATERAAQLEADRDAAVAAADRAAGVDTTGLLEETEEEAERRSELAEADGVTVSDGDLILDDPSSMWWNARPEDMGNLSAAYQKLQGISNLFKEWLGSNFPEWTPGVTIFNSTGYYSLDHAILGKIHILAGPSRISPTDPDKVGVSGIHIQTEGFSSDMSLNMYIQEYSISANAFLHTPEPT